MGNVVTTPVTIADFDKLQLPSDRKWELHNGEVVEVPFPSIVHKRLQKRVADILERAFPEADVLEEYPFEVPATNDKRSADVGLTTADRGAAASQKGVLEGTPELVVEVLSPSNTVIGLKQFRNSCFEHGTEVFLTIDSSDNTVEHHLSSDQQGSLLRIGQDIRFSLFGEQKTIPVLAIFEGITA